MQCEPRWGDGLSTSNSVPVERPSPHPATRYARVDPPPQGAGGSMPYFFAAAARSTNVLPPFILWASGASLI